MAELFGSAEAARPFEGGALVVSRLCPVDYHRFHFPLAGTPGRALRLPGPLDSVSPVALRAGARALAANKRELTILDNTIAGRVALIEVGASCVGRIVQGYAPGQPVARGAEKGYFLFGGSTTITVFEPGKVTLDADLTANTTRGLETYAPMGSRMGVAR
jgi:phosphatidylserine decarboxylase